MAEQIPEQKPQKQDRRNKDKSKASAIVGIKNIFQNVKANPAYEN